MLQSLDANVAPARFRWSDMMTVPRELTLENGGIYQRPVRELKGYGRNMVRYEGLAIADFTTLKNISGRVLEFLA